jgi:hypothetical protein
VTARPPGYIRRVRRSLRWVLAVLGPAALFAGCGEERHANDYRPPEPITITALIDGKHVRVSPAKFGAGPIMLLVSNQSGRAQKLTFETASSGTGIRSSADVPLDGTAQLQVSPKRGDYQLSVRARGVKPAAVHVGAPRASSQNDLLRP